MSPDVIGFSILLIGIILVIGKLIRIKFNIFSKYFLPSSVLGGGLMLLIGPEVLGRLWQRFELFSDMGYGLITEDIHSVMSSIPGLLISVIFASLFLGKKIPKFKDIWMIAGPQVSYGQTVAWGQYVFGILITLLVLVPLFDANPLSGALIEIAFEGGHGTAAGLGDTFSDLGFAEGTDLALGLATVGVVSGVIIGVILINWGVRKQKTNYLKSPQEFDEAQLRGIVDIENRESGSTMTTSPQSIEPLAMHVGFIGIAILIGYIFQQLLIYIESITYGASGDILIMVYLPLFPLAMLGGVILQIFLDKFDRFKLVDRDTITRIQGLSLDFLIVAAIGTISLQAIGDNIFVFLILAITGILWNVLAFMFIARHMIPKNWFERGIGDFGQSMGMTAAGLMLIRIVDSKGDTKALEAFGYKQLLFEPFVGGGLMTAVSVPLIYQFGAVPILIFTLIVMVGWLLLGLFYFGKKDANEVT